MLADNTTILDSYNLAKPDPPHDRAGPIWLRCDVDHLKLYTPESLDNCKTDHVEISLRAFTQRIVLKKEFLKLQFWLKSDHLNPLAN